MLCVLGSVVIALIALVGFGGSRIPEPGRSLEQATREVKQGVERAGSERPGAPAAGADGKPRAA